jgi:hypothetical protein
MYEIVIKSIAPTAELNVFTPLAYFNVELDAGKVYEPLPPIVARIVIDCPLVGLVNAKLVMLPVMVVV